VIKPALQKILKGLLHIEQETRVSDTGRFKKKKTLLIMQSSKQGIGKTKQQGNKNDWKQQAPLNISTEYKWTQCPKRHKRAY
jgi:hypothetical protein